MKTDGAVLGIFASVIIGFTAASYWFTNQKVLSHVNLQSWSKQQEAGNNQRASYAQGQSSKYSGNVTVANVRNSLNQTVNIRSIEGTLINNTNAPITDITLRYAITQNQKRKDGGTFCAHNCETDSLKKGQSLNFSHRVLADGDPQIISVLWKYPDGSPGYQSFEAPQQAYQSRSYTGSK